MVFVAPSVLEPQEERTRLSWPIAGKYLVGGALVAAPWLNPYSPGPSVGAVSCLFGAICLGTLCLFIERRMIVWMACSGWIAAAVLSAMMALLQYTGKADLLAPWVSAVSGPGEAFANLRQPNQFASLTSIGLVTLLFLVRGGTGGLYLLGACTLSALLALANAASASRTGLVQWVMVAALWWCWRERGQLFSSQAKVLVTGLIVYVAAALMLPELVGSSRSLFPRLMDGAPDCSSRLVLWSNVLELIGQKPWLGWGWGELDHAHFMTPYDGERFCAILDNAHNLPLHLAVELGVPLAALACGGVAWLAWRAMPLREHDPERQLAWSVLAVILLHSLVEYPLWYGPFQAATALSVAMLAVRPGVTLAVTTRHILRTTTGLVLALIFWMAWDYWCASQIYLPPESRMRGWQTDTLAKSRRAIFFGDQVAFAELTLTPLAPGNAEGIYALADRTLHFSPEPRVIEKLVESAVVLNRDEEALTVLSRYRAAFPTEHAAWASRQTGRP